MFTDVIGDYGKKALDGIVSGLARLNPNPNHLTFIGLLITLCSAILYGYGYFFYAGLVMIFAALFDLLDGQVARVTNRTTKFGAVFDSVIDRYSDIMVLVGIMVFYARDQVTHSTLYVALAGIALVGSALTSYTRARAENLIPKCRVGFLERPERLVILIIASLTEVPWIPRDSVFVLHKMPQSLWLIAVLSHWTVAHRVYHTWREIRQLEGAIEDNPVSQVLDSRGGTPAIQGVPEIGAKAEAH